MYSIKKHTVSALVILAVLVSTNQTYAKSIYAITSHHDFEISVYEVVGNVLEYQMDDEYPASSSGAVGLALDPESSTLFVSYDGDNRYFSIINAKTMELIEKKQMGYEFGGLVFDNSRRRLYAARRDTKYICIYNWNPDSRNLLFIEILQLDELAGPLGQIFGISLDETDGMLYVSEGTNKIYMYDTNDDWSYEGYFEIKVDGNEREAVGIDVYNDGEGSRYLYSGSRPHGESHDYLVRTNIDDPNYAIEVLVGTAGDSEEVAGVAVDDDTGLVYVTTFHQDIRVYTVNTEPNLVLLHVEETPGDNPADIVLAGDVQYKPWIIELTKSDDIAEEATAEGGDSIKYTLCYENNEPNTITNVVLIDFLPAEVDFVSAEPSENGTYNSDPNFHTYTWQIGTVEPNTGPFCLDLNVKVNDTAVPWETIRNVCELEGDQSYGWADEFTDLGCWARNIIYVDEDVVGGEGDGSSWANAYTNLQSALSKAVVCDEIRVAEGVYKPTEEAYDSEATFELINGLGLYGGYAGNTDPDAARDWMAYETVLCGDPNSDDDTTKGFGYPEERHSVENVNYVVTCGSGVEGGVLDGFIISNALKAGIASYGTDLTIEHNRIRYNKTGVDSDGDDAMVIRNNWIFDNGSGFEFYDPTAVTVHNNTIVYNQYLGMSLKSGTSPTVKNCIFWGHPDANDVVNCAVTYSCSEQEITGDGNINDDPLFVDADSDDYHLDPQDSPCIDEGDHNDNYDGETDIDGEPRIMSGGDFKVDMGADEVLCYVVGEPRYYEFDGTPGMNITQANYDAWVLAERPVCWCCPHNGIGDTNNSGTINQSDYVPIFNNMNTPTIPELLQEPEHVCADVNHSGSIEQSDYVPIFNRMNTGDGVKCELWEDYSKDGGDWFDSLTLEEQIDYVSKLIESLEYAWENDKEFRESMSKEVWEKGMAELYDWLEDLKKQAE